MIVGAVISRHGHVDGEEDVVAEVGSGGAIAA